jgi:hypothetical protein
VTGTPLDDPEMPVQTDEMKTLLIYDAETGAMIGRHVLPRPQSQYENCTIHNYNIAPFSKRDVLEHGSYQSGAALVDFTDPMNAYEFAWMDPTRRHPRVPAAAPPSAAVIGPRTGTTATSTRATRGAASTSGRCGRGRSADRSSGSST